MSKKNRLLSFFGFTPMGHRLRLAGTVEFSGLNRNLVQGRVDMLAEGSAGYLRGLDDVEVLGQGCDLRPCTADGLPVLGMAAGDVRIDVSLGKSIYPHLDVLSRVQERKRAG